MSPQAFGNLGLHLLNTDNLDSISPEAQRQAEGACLYCKGKFDDGEDWRNWGGVCVVERGISGVATFHATCAIMLLILGRDMLTGFDGERLDAQSHYLSSWIVRELDERRWSSGDLAGRMGTYWCGTKDLKRLDEFPFTEKMVDAVITKVVRPDEYFLYGLAKAFGISRDDVAWLWVGEWLEEPIDPKLILNIQALSKKQLSQLEKYMQYLSYTRL